MQKIINESTVLNFYLELMEEDKVTFLENKESVKKEIAGLILKLDELPDIHQKIQVAKDLWKILFEEAMSTLNPDKRGYDRLFKYFDEYVNFEELIFASDSFYRDHTLHCLWVYFLGEYLYCQDEFKNIFKYIFEETTVVYEMEELSETKGIEGVFGEFAACLKPMNNVMRKSDAIRCLAALTHDLGYPLKKIQKINKSISNILPYFAIHNFDEFDFSYTNEQNMSVESFVDAMSRNLTFDTGDKEGKTDIIFEKIAGMDQNRVKSFDKEAILQLSEEELDELRKLKPRVSYGRGQCNYNRYSEDFENYEHGIMSAFILYKTLMNSKDYRYYMRDSGRIRPEEADFEKEFANQLIYTTIADHTSPAMQISSINNPSAFLILIDELEEFSRISRANQNRQYISEFCKSSIYMDDDSFCVDFIFDNKEIVNLDPERAFKGRCGKMLSLFNIPKLDEDFKLRLRCIDALHDTEKIYELSIAHKYANITIDGIEKNIPKYLKTRELYTRGEYAQM